MGSVIGNFTDKELAQRVSSLLGRRLRSTVDWNTVGRILCWVQKQRAEYLVGPKPNWEEVERRFRAFHNPDESVWVRYWMTDMAMTRPEEVVTSVVKRFLEIYEPPMPEPKTEEEKKQDEQPLPPPE